MNKTLRTFSICLLSFAVSHTLSASSVQNYLLVVRNNSIVFDAFETESLNETAIEDIVISDQPELGKLAVNNDYTLTFKPNPDICETEDTFSYLLKRKDGIDTVNVHVEIICEKLTFLSGFSPDGDGINDTFVIIGVDSYPDNSLVVFNKWGEEVFSEMNYQNTWDGTDKNGDPLMSEENVYYYVFNDGEGGVYSGYMKIE